MNARLGSSGHRKRCVILNLYINNRHIYVLAVNDSFKAKLSTLFFFTCDIKLSVKYSVPDMNHDFFLFFRYLTHSDMCNKFSVFW